VVGRTPELHLAILNTYSMALTSLLPTMPAAATAFLRALLGSMTASNSSWLQSAQRWTFRR
jgi:hypothetical protein